MHITAQGPHLRNDLYCVEWDVKPYYTILILVQAPADLVVMVAKSRQASDASTVD